jgi:hypothetical protein
MRTLLVLFGILVLAPALPAQAIPPAPPRTATRVQLCQALDYRLDVLRRLRQLERPNPRIEGQILELRQQIELIREQLDGTDLRLYGGGGGYGGYGGGWSGNYGGSFEMRPYPIPRGGYGGYGGSLDCPTCPQPYGMPLQVGRPGGAVRYSLWR